MKKGPKRIKNPPSRSGFCSFCKKKIVEFDTDLFGDRGYISNIRICPDCLSFHTHTLRN